MSLGRHELLEWINAQMQTEYTTVEGLADGVAYAQVIDAVNPGSINILRLNLATKYPEDNYRNIRLLQDALKKIKVPQPFSFEKISKGKFQDNIVFLQWLYGHATKSGRENLQAYLPYEKRLKILQKQGKGPGDMNLHLRPNEAYYGEEWQAGVQAQQQVGVGQEQIQSGLERTQEFVRMLQGDLKQKMQLNWRMMFLIDKTIEQRNSLYNLLSHIDKIVQQYQPSPLRDKLQQILHEKPAEFQ